MKTIKLLAIIGLLAALSGCDLFDTDLTGTWAYSVTWSNGSTDASKWVCLADKTWATPTNSYHGTWESTGQDIVVTYSTGTVFTGTVSGTTISGNVVSYTGSTGTFTATRQ